MADFYIKKLYVTSLDEKVHPAEIEFQKGTNIIYGTSDSGKSYIIECIDYMFGAKSMRLKHSSGYDTVRLDISTSQGEIHLERRFDRKKEQVSIYSTDMRFERLNCTGASSDTLDSFWLQLIGIGENQTVITSGYYAREQLKWSNIKPMFLVKEDNISKAKPVIPTSTKSLSALLLLLTGRDYSEEPTLESDADRRKKAKGVREYIVKRMRELGTQQLELMQKIGSQEVIEQEKNWESLLDRFSSKEKELDNAIARSHQLHADLEEVRHMVSAYRLQKENHILLQGLYDAQMKRLSFTMEGQLLTKLHGEACQCPFCNSKIESSKISPEVLQATKAELEQAESTIRAFEHDTEELDKSIAEACKRESDLQMQCAELDRMITTSYVPEVDALKRQLNVHVQTLQDRHDIEYLGEELESLQTQKDALEVKSTDRSVLFHPKDEFPNEFFHGMSESLTEMLATWSPSELKQIFFERATMDVNADWQDKNTFGEGYRACLNTAVAFCLFKYLCESGKYAPGLLLIDSPIQAMKEKDGSFATSELFSYIVKHSSCGQVFIVDNKLPNNFNSEGANVRTFDENGFLPDFTHPSKIRKEHTQNVEGQQQLI